MRQTSLRALILASLAGAVGVTTADAQGQHLGWCIGVGNPHRSADCGTSSTMQTTGTTQVPTATQLPQTSGGTLPTPATVATTTITVQPLAPTTVTGFGPVGASIVVRPNPPTVVVGYGAVPQLPPQLVPGQVPQPVLQPIPDRVPTLAPPLVPGQVPVAVPGQVPPMIPALVPRPRPTGAGTVTGQAAGSQTGGGTIRHQQQPRGPALGPGHVTGTTGRQALHEPPAFAAADGGQPWRCLASGHGKRRTLSGDTVVSDGALRHVGAIDLLGRDLPALHPDHADCIISVRRRRD
ncbi:MAG: hypothetical protein NXH83_11160 [Rhodobacteraceae bacterium]|nr:hypothetical protein [Paracoccaceae bacterium]